MISSMPVSWYSASRSIISSGGQMMRFSSSSSTDLAHGSGAMQPLLTRPGPLNTLSNRP